MEIPRSSIVTGGEEEGRVELLSGAGEDADRAGARLDELCCCTGRAVDLWHAGTNNAAIRSRQASRFLARRQHKRPVRVAPSQCWPTFARFEGRIGATLSPNQRRDKGDFGTLWQLPIATFPTSCHASATPTSSAARSRLPEGSGWTAMGVPLAARLPSAQDASVTGAALFRRRVARWHLLSTSPWMHQRTGMASSRRGDSISGQAQQFTFSGARDHFAVLERSFRAAGLLGSPLSFMTSPRTIPSWKCLKSR